MTFDPRSSTIQLIFQLRLNIPCCVYGKFMLGNVVLYTAVYTLQTRIRNTECSKAPEIKCRNHQLSVALLAVLARLKRIK